MSVIHQRTRLVLRKMSPGATLDFRQHEILWMGLGILLGFFIISIVFGVLETIRGNSPDAFNEKVENLRTLENTVQELRTAKVASNNARDAAVSERDAMTVERDAAIAERDAAIVRERAANAERIAAENTRNTAIAERDAAIVRERTANAERIVAGNTRNTTIRERDDAIVRERAANAERIAAENARDAVIEERDRIVADQDQTIRELRLQVNTHRQGATVAGRELQTLRRELERRERRINFLQEEIIRLQTTQQQNVDSAAAGTLEDLETVVAELRLNLNNTNRNLRNETRTRIDLQRDIARRDRRITFLDQRIAELNVVDASDEDGDDPFFSAAETRPQTPAVLSYEQLSTSGPIPNSEVQRLVSGMQQILHIMGRCPYANLHRDQIEPLNLLTRRMRDLVGDLNDSMFEELTQLVLDVMGHLGINQ